MMPTADQVARAVIAATKECGIYEKFKIKTGSIGVRPPHNLSAFDIELKHVRTYVALALRAAFPACPSASIGRCVGAGKPQSFLGLILTWKAKGNLAWYDPEIEARVIAAIGPIDQQPEQTVIDETGDESVVTTVPVFLPKPPEKFVFVSDPRPASKSRLEEELRQAVLNTGGRLK